MTRDDVIAVIKKHISENLDDVNVDELDFDRSMKDYGANSLDVIEIVSCSMRDLKLKVPRNELDNVQTINQLTDVFLKFTA